MLVLAIICATLPLECPTPVEARRVNYRGWPDCVRLANSSVEMVIVPSIGRIMRFAPTGGPNMLWENPALLGAPVAPPDARTEWANFGGDKLWPAPQDRWGWPPDPYLDGSPWTVRIRPDRSVEMLSPISPTLGIRFRRVIALDNNALSASIRNELINVGERTVEWSLWEVAQVSEPDWVDMPVHRRGAFAQGYRILPDNPAPGGAVSVRGDRVVATRESRQAYKIGGDPPRTDIRALQAGWLFTITGPRRVPGIYPDEGCSVEIFSSPDPLPYMEMEVLGPITPIESGRRTTLVTRWTLARSPRRSL